MTKQEAIRLLKSIKSSGDVAWIGSQRIEAIDMAISALETPDLPPDLEAASEEYCKQNEPTNQSCDNCIKQVFKAGAKWMAA